MSNILLTHILTEYMETQIMRLEFYCNLNTANILSSRHSIGFALIIDEIIRKLHFATLKFNLFAIIPCFNFLNRLTLRSSTAISPI